MKPLNHNSDMIEVPIIKEQEALEPISYPENSTLHNNSQNDLGLRSQKNYPPLETSSIENDLISDSDIKHILTCDKKKESSTSSHPISNNNPVLSEQNAKIKVPEIDIQPLIQELLIEPSEEDCVKVINVEDKRFRQATLVEESAAVDQLPAIELAYLYKKTKFAKIKTIRTKSDEIISWYCYRSDATAPAKSKVRIPIAPTNSSVPVNSPVIPYDAHAPYINMTLKEYLYLFLYNSNKHND
ncbi:unnamed protein product [Rhizophagus irregularis]|uniref:Uncharacterized protein n=1 Tax=Rhizophagus irregularis TaxID=588596 RepID=A0A916E7X8_9GLOM|nr:unnamed protein product [Rhizophagus irregularis]